MAITRALPELEAWLGADAESWAALADREYRALVRRWSEGFAPLVEAGAARFQGHRAMRSLESWLPADVVLFSGLRVPRLANMGGHGPAAYRAIGLRRLRRDLANRMELIVVSEDLAWSCVFSHEAGAVVWESLYERGPACPGEGEAPMADDLIQMSKFLSLVLRHKPEAIGLTLDAHGWADVEELIRLANRRGTPLTRPLLERLVAESDKQRFALSEDGARVRANQGHSVEVDLGLSPSEPPPLLYHGTASRFLDSIRREGLHAAGRQHVHLSPDVATATKVGQRHGRPVVLTVRAGAMAAAGHPFFRSANGVWLAERVPAEFLDIPAD